MSAVPEDRDHVGEAADFLQPMADVDDRHAAIPKLADGGEEIVDLVRGERCRRLIHDQQTGICRERLGDLEQLPVRDTKPSHGGVGSEVDPEIAENAHRLRLHGAPVDRAQPTARMTACEHVLGHAEVGEHRRFLVHRHDPEPVGCLSVTDPRWLAVDQELAVVLLDDARDDLHQGRLAGTVLADESVHRPCPDREADVGESLDSSIALRDVPKLEQRLRRRVTHRG